MAPAPPPAARPPKTPKRTLKRQKSGILTSVFTFVSQEVQNFVATATGSANPEDLEGDEEESEYGSEEGEEGLYEEHTRRLNDVSPPRKSRSSQVADSSPRNKRARRSPSPEQLDHAQQQPRPILTRRARGPTMPGSLIPFSPGSEFDDGDDDDLTHSSKHVHFDGLSPGSAVDLTNSEDHDEIERTPRRRAKSPQTPPNKSRASSLIRTPSSSVKKAVEKFTPQSEGEADPSMLLPMQHSPSRPKTRAVRDAHSPSSQHDKGKAPAKPYDRTFGASQSASYHREERSETQSTGTFQHGDSEAELSVDSELKIRILEEEVRRLRDELSRRPPSQSDFSAAMSAMAPPAPPPPPPPPTGTIFRVPTEPHNPDAVFATVRAHLKHTTPPKEKPINRLNGRPSVGVPPDKMAAFLTELKTVRLKKVADKDKSFASDGDLSLMSAPSFVPPPRVHRKSLDGPLAEKRKRLVEDDRTTEELDRLWKRRSVLSASTRSQLSYGTGNTSNNSSSFDSSISSNSSRTESRAPVPRAKTQPTPLSLSDSLIRDWRATTSAASSVTSSHPEAPTPSLCSDQDGESQVTDDPLPSTPPPDSHNIIAQFRPPTPPRRKESSIRDILPQEHDEDVQYEISLRIPPTPDAPVYEHEHEDMEFIPAQPTTDAAGGFARRAPNSPLPEKSPRRPRPPARSPKRSISRKPANTSLSTSLPRRAVAASDDEGGYDENGNLSTSFSRPQSQNSNGSRMTLLRPSLPKTNPALAAAARRLAVTSSFNASRSFDNSVMASSTVRDDGRRDNVEDHEEEDDDDDDDANKTTTILPESLTTRRTISSASVSKNSPRPTPSRNILRRRQTLDDELRRSSIASESSIAISATGSASFSMLTGEELPAGVLEGLEDEDGTVDFNFDTMRGGMEGVDDGYGYEEDDLEDGMYVGVGTNERRGFLAHGGAGGPAVWTDL
ncbi:hypothetical protein D9611_001688 [Ephemerocybe angulata]|uniref:Uncharacterized protein n=1 Tax=Ephemerocybe angulata TaxID=980116 RepID=A0A8H5CHU2_9AGAR|nr:hypothetical protein D9611_001688 [Tulosesus angulatus]